MPTPVPTLAAFEADIRAKAGDVDLSRSAVRREAKRRQRLFIDYGSERASRILGIISDPTPCEAFRDLTDNDKAAARRLGIEPAADVAVAS